MHTAAFPVKAFAGLCVLQIFVCCFLYAQPPQPSWWRNSPDLASFHIVVPEGASPSLKQAGNAFEHLWRLSTRRAITRSAMNEGRTNVWLSSHGIADDLIPSETLSSLSSEEFLVRTYTPTKRDAERGVQKQMLIVGGSDLAINYGVRYFFGHVMGTFWLEPGVVHAPRPPRGIAELDLRHRPEFALREIGLLTLWHEGVEEYRLGHYLPPVSLAHPGRCDYFDHFADGSQMPVDAKDLLPYGNAEGAEMLLEMILQEHQNGKSSESAFCWDTPLGFIWRLSAITHMAPVLAEEGAELNSREASPAAAILYTANSLAALLEEVFPGETHLVHVLLSPITQKAPISLKTHPKVIVQLSTAACNFAAPLSDRNCRLNTQFATELDRWAKLGARIHILDFLTNQREPRLPFPNLHVLSRNLLLYTQKRVEGVYYAGAPTDFNDTPDLAALRVFLAATLLTDPDTGYEECIQSFLENYYGSAAPVVREYLDTCQKELLESQTPLLVEDQGVWLPEKTLAEAQLALESSISNDLDDALRERIASLQNNLQVLQQMRALEPEKIPDPHVEGGTK